MLRLVFVAAFVAISIACSTPPDKERHQAEGAIAAARAADAAIYAADVLAIAETALSGYDAAVAQRDYREALRLALEARESAFRAARKASDEKAAVRSRAEQLVAELTTLLTPVAPSSEVRPAGGPRSAGETSPAAVATPPLLQDARSKLEQADYRGVEQLLTPEIVRLRAETAASRPTPTPSSR